MKIVPKQLFVFPQNPKKVPVDFLDKGKGDLYRFLPFAKEPDGVCPHILGICFPRHISAWE